MYQIKLPVFEGPFDLLLFLIKKNEIDVYDIPIAQITTEYLSYIEMMQMLDLEIAGEFIEMVATLILIKTRMLLPRTSTEEGQEDIEDPRMQLTLQLLQYKRFKEAAEALNDYENEQRRYFPRRTRAGEIARKAALENDDFEIEASLFDLMTAFKRALDNMPKITVHQVNRINVSVNDQARYLIQQFDGKSHLSFFEALTRFPEKIYAVVTFMAVLDLMRHQMIYAKQSDAFEDIRLVPRGEVSISRYEAIKNAVDIAPDLTPDSQDEKTVN